MPDQVLGPKMTAEISEGAENYVTWSDIDFQWVVVHFSKKYHWSSQPLLQKCVPKLHEI